jgi:MFS family permease
MPRHQQDDSESSPLLRGNTQQPQQDASQPSTKIVRAHWLQITNPQTINAVQSFIIFCTALSALLAAVPQAQLLEDAVCREYFDGIWSPRGTQDDELRCKITPVEARLASLTGISSTLEMSAELIVALPMGILADRFGKRPVMLWAALSSLLSFSWVLLVIRFSDMLPVSMVLFSFVPRLLGGGETVLLAMLYSITADIAPAALR